MARDRAARWVLLLAAFIALVYLSAILVGLRVKNFSLLQMEAPAPASKPWEPPPQSLMPGGPLGDSIRRGAHIFDETPLYAPHFTGAKVSCANCHAQGGTQPYAAPMVGLPATFPKYNPRAGHIISLKDRIQECFVRSENGKPLAYDGPEMRALVDYIQWLSTPEPNARPFVGRGLVDLPDLKPDPARGGGIYAAQCAGCHGQNGEGQPPQFPAVWGPASFNDGAGMNDVHKMAAFVQRNMPQNRKGILSPQDALDVSAFIHSQPRPAFDQAYSKF